jgi:hypothetical protein
MAKDLIPGTDAEFNTFLKQFVGAVTTNPGAYGLSAADLAPIQDALAKWSAAYPAHLDAQQAALAASEIKAKGREIAEKATRFLVKKIEGHPEIDNALRVSAGLPPRENGKSVIGAPTTRPIGRVETKSNSTLVIHFVDEETPLKKAKPEGVHACEIRIHVGETPPTDASGFTFLAHDTRTPYADEHPSSDAGKTAHYVLRWLNAKLEPGPWSDVVSAKIPL